ncbi:MAG: TlpA family protein disulfide reductase [Acidobacteria bacterium]|nr:TlpA family protein disulfide reductase [Acidobacteriota bacterium]
MDNKRALAVVAGVAGVALLALGVRYSYRVAGLWGDPGDLADGGEKIKIQLLVNPVTLTPVTMRTLDGKTLSSADWRGKVTIVNFWATWCPPCLAEIPDLVALQDKYRDQLQIIGISADEGSPEVVQKFADQYHINYPIVMKTPELEKAFPGVYALPTSFVIGRDLKVEQKHVGMLSAVRTEAETRVLAGLSANVEIERVEDSTKQLIKDAAQATKIPGIDIEKLSSDKRAAVLRQLNADNCTCGCGLTLAACRINDPTCSVSLPIAQKIVADATR